MNTKQAIKICEKKGWYVNITKYVLQKVDREDMAFFDTDQELIDYATEISNNNLKKKKSEEVDNNG